MSAIIISFRSTVCIKWPKREVNLCFFLANLPPCQICGQQNCQWSYKIHKYRWSAFCCLLGDSAVQCMQCVALDEKCLSGTMAADIKFYGCCILDHNVLNVSWLPNMSSKCSDLIVFWALYTCSILKRFEWIHDPHFFLSIPFSVIFIV